MTPSLLRVYDRDREAFGPKGYPIAWDRCPGCNGTGWRCAANDGPADPARGRCCDTPGGCPSMNGCPDCLAAEGFGGSGSIKALVRVLAGDRCVRCHHPYQCGKHGNGEWSPCDRRCAHRGRVRLSYTASDDSLVEGVQHELGVEAAVVVGYGKLVEARWRILTVHHLDGDKANCRWWNLAALCQRCHLTIQGRVMMDRPWPWEHSAWFRPFAAAWYGVKYLGEDLDRDQVLARVDELLELGQRAERVERMAV